VVKGNSDFWTHALHDSDAYRDPRLWSLKPLHPEPFFYSRPQLFANAVIAGSRRPKEKPRRSGAKGYLWEVQMKLLQLTRKSRLF